MATPERSGLRAFATVGGIVAALLLALGTAPPAAAATFDRLDIGRPDIAIFVMNGPMVEGDTVRLEREISLLPANLPVAMVLNSPGGKLNEGISLGRFFYSAKIPTFVLGFGGGCHSACSLAFLGGRDRITGRPARFKMASGALGFHQFRPGAPSEEQRTKAYTKTDIDTIARQTRLQTFAIIAYLKAIGEDMSKLHLMLQAPTEKLRFVSNEEALALGIHIMGDDAADFIEASHIVERVKAP
jgi:hypothetical protein